MKSKMKKVVARKPKLALKGLALAKKLRQEWIKALRSGKYQKGKDALEPKKGQYCCLGVACKVYEKVTGESAIYEDDKLYGQHLEDQPAVGRAFGFREDGLERLSCMKEEVIGLTDLNDDYGYSFKRIATVIEKSGKDLWKG